MILLYKVRILLFACGFVKFLELIGHEFTFSFSLFKHMLRVFERVLKLRRGYRRVGNVVLIDIVAEQIVHIQVRTVEVGNTPAIGELLLV